MGCLSSIEAPITIVITTIFLAFELYAIAFNVVESTQAFDKIVLEPKDMLMPALAIMSLIGTCSSRRAFGVFTLLFMLYAFIFSSFQLFRLTMIYIKTFDSPCLFMKTASNDGLCHAVSIANLICAVISMISTALASMAIFIRLATVTINISDLRSMATTRSFNPIPELISRKAIESEREEDIETQTPRRKMGQADIFV